MMENKIHVPNHQPVYIYIYVSNYMQWNCTPSAGRMENADKSSLPPKFRHDQRGTAWLSSIILQMVSHGGSRDNQPLLLLS